MLDDDFHLLRDVRVVQVDKPRHFPLGGNGSQLGIVLNRFIDMAVGLPCNIVVQHIQDIAFFDSLWY
jgi:hypothetical protein